ncbi:MAG TPA: LysM peptidoglycan-binding domain-containing protein [Candidatus Binataceae bacterium]|nr:LysM peptidoglycan-binding domain-containing protein [Candidatus Binataceae bacterium]
MAISARFQALPSLAMLLCLALSLALMAEVGTAMAVTEEDIPPETAATSRAPAPPSAGDSAVREGNSAAPSVIPAVPAPRLPRSTFPYQVKEGDNWGSIAALFGVSVDDLLRVNRAGVDTELQVGQMLRIPNPAVARERELTDQVNQLSQRTTDAEARAQQAESALAEARARLADLAERERQVDHDLATVYWWRMATYLMAVVSLLMFAATAVALVDWWLMRNRFRSVAEMNESLRRLDYRYRNALARAELRLQELYGRRRRGLRDGQERARLAEETEIDALNQELKAILEYHLRRLGPARKRAARRARETLLGEIASATVEPRAVRR